MTNKTLFNRFEIESEIYADEIFRYVEAVDVEQDRNPVLVVQLKAPWCDKQAIVNDLIEYFEPLQSLKAKEVVPVVIVLKNKIDGFAVVFERPSGISLNDIDELESAIPASQFIDGLCDAIHKINVKGIIHGHLRKQDIWIDGDAVKIFGFGCSILFQHGWRGTEIEVAPEIKQGLKPDARSEVYSIARLVSECFPGSSNNSVLRKALKHLPSQRFDKIRAFQSELIQSWNTPSGTGLKPKPTGNNTDEHVEETNSDRDNRSSEQPAVPVNGAKEGWYYFSNQEFYGKNYSAQGLFSTLNRVFYNEVLDCAENTMESLNYILEAPDFYDLWLENQGGFVKLDRHIDVLEKKTKFFRNKLFKNISENRQEKIVCLNRRLLEVTYPELCPVREEVKRDSTKGSGLKYTLILLAVIASGALGAHYYLDSRVFQNDMVKVDAGEYQSTPYLKRFFGAMGGKSIVINQPFSIQVGEVTVGEFKQYANNLDTRAKNRLGVLWKQTLSGSSYSNNRPVDYISRRDAAGYAQWISNRDGVDMQLPTYAQWAAAVITYAEANPVLASKKNSPMEEVRTQPDHLIGNLREWSSETCGNNKYLLLGEDYMTDMEALGELPCIKDIRKWKGVGFRLIRVGGI